MKKSDILYIVCCLAVIIIFTLMAKRMWRQGECEKAQQYIGQRYQETGDYRQVIEDCERITVDYPGEKLKEKNEK